MEDFFLNLKAIHPGELVKILRSDTPPKCRLIWEFKNEIKPIDLYCYLYAKYGAPNGIQNFLRSDDSDNLIHWEWALSSDFGVILIQGHNFRSEILLIGDFEHKNLSLQMFIEQIKPDIGNYGKQIKEIREKLEKWTQFVNPFHRIESAVNQHLKKIEDLNLNIDLDRISQPMNSDEMKTSGDRWNAVSEKYSYAVGLVFGLRSMLPVLAESFVNLVLFILSKPEIKQNDRLFQNTLRQQIDIRIQSLHLNCTGFKNPVDYTAEECKKLHTLMNERNDLLHGNVEVNKLSIGDIFFSGNVPLFIQYEDFWDKSIGVSLNSVKFDSIQDDYSVVIKFIKYILEQLDPKTKEFITMVLDKRKLGYNKKTGKIGILLPEHLVDFRGVFPK